MQFLLKPFYVKKVKYLNRNQEWISSGRSSSPIFNNSLNIPSSIPTQPVTECLKLSHPLLPGSLNRGRWHNLKFIKTLSRRNRLIRSNMIVTVESFTNNAHNNNRKPL